MKPLVPIALALAAALAGCAQGNLRTPASYAALAPPTVRNPPASSFSAKHSLMVTGRTKAHSASASN